ncbi:hypothetical protein [Kitasatospora cinereorecta]|uniref:Uncharacterized protein n=1 Tax=Kitasatospora cinereorecta TaxID=285560 RepID=A0ABW0VC87_9ACTN
MTNNHTDFGDGTTYPYPMDQDLGDLADRLKQLTDFDEVVTAFTETVSSKQARTAAEAYLKSDRVTETIAQTAAELLRSPLGFPGTGEGHGLGLKVRSTGSPGPALARHRVSATYTSGSFGSRATSATSDPLALSTSASHAASTWRPSEVSVTSDFSTAAEPTFRR